MSDPDRNQPNEVSRGGRPLDQDAATAHAQHAQSAPASGQDTQDSLPSFVQRHFLRSGNEFYHRREPDRLAFRASTTSFRAEEVSESVATAMVELAAQRGWTTIKVSGANEFRQLVWAAAAKKGLAVEGYKPSRGEQALATETVDPGDASKSSSRSGTAAQDSASADGRQRAEAREEPIFRGEFVAYGPAHFRDDPSKSMSFRVRVRGPDGREYTHWGVDLERARTESRAQIGDHITLSKGPSAAVDIDGGDGTTRSVQRARWTIGVDTRTPPAVSPNQNASDIVLAAEGGVYWTGESGVREPWTDDPRRAKSFATPRHAWEAAIALEAAQAKYLEGDRVQLHIRDADEPQRPKFAVSLGAAKNLPVLRAAWQSRFAEPMPDDLSMPHRGPIASPTNPDAAAVPARSTDASTDPGPSSRPTRGSQSPEALVIEDFSDRRLSHLPEEQQQRFKEMANAEIGKMREKLRMPPQTPVTERTPDRAAGGRER